jgi:hypothetical protein
VAIGPAAVGKISFLFASDHWHCNIIDYDLTGNTFDQDYGCKNVLLIRKGETYTDIQPLARDLTLAYTLIKLHKNIYSTTRFHAHSQHRTMGSQN